MCINFILGFCAINISYTSMCDWILENQPKCHARPIPFYCLQLIGTLIDHPCTVTLPGLANWYVFLK